MTENIVWFNFNHAQEQIRDKRERKEKLRSDLLNNLSSYLLRLLPSGHIRGHKFYIGDINGNKGKSLVVELRGTKKGIWHDFATGEGGDVFGLWAAVLSKNGKFGDLLDAVDNWLGYCSSFTKIKSSKLNDLGAYTAKWDYLNSEGKLIACVYRYDLKDGKKQYRPWDIKTSCMRAPDPRPLYNQPGIKENEWIILVEGEKCAEALIRQGICATTAMNGAQAPINKTDWSPLIGKQVIVWPDNDEPGLAYAQEAAKAILNIGASSVKVLTPPSDKPIKWDAADAVFEGFDVAEFLREAQSIKLKQKIPAYSFGALLQDASPMPEDLISPRVLTQGGLLVFGGASKVGKSDFLLSWFTHMAIGEPFLGLKPPKPLKIFYCQLEVQYHYLRERVKSLDMINKEQIELASQNLMITPQLHMLLNDEGVLELTKAIHKSFSKGVDIIAIDPIRNLFDGGSNNGGENDNNAMLFFLTQRIEKLRAACNPNCGIILVHHTRKIGKKQFEEDPFQALSGAGSLRSFYSSGMLLFKPDETKSERHLYFELRNGLNLPKKIVDKLENKWVELEQNNERVICQAYGKKLDLERDRKQDIILQLITEEAHKGHLYTSNQFAEKFENKAGLGGKGTIIERISVLATKGYIKFCKDLSHLGYAKSKSKYGFLCVEDMYFSEKRISVLPSHYKCSNTGAILPVENQTVWVVH
ncbi:putative Bacteriophage-related DNA primase [endosymbiont of Acanthamoeba sp. UWC8]|uniref:AAA family ATPase n=1 Tax=endosymbiont of Acanthamoeba sp. UWC8 TaxID=86106 RepID=UPI0004D164CC|nr:AAA family ATPase [endosymbiont of Acanthamoeba sp. UWC8]AIF81432.1 putative Bacteriophage-related DNA primase [endosymbiont of Acanthamoeba sp. UWC8]